MKVCIPVTADNGLESPVSEHFGKAPLHIVIESNSMAWEFVKKESDCSSSEHGHCMPANLLVDMGVEVILCKGIGRGAMARLLSHDIAVHRTEEKTALKSLENWMDQLLPFVSEKDLCPGHHGSAEHGH